MMRPDLKNTILNIETSPSSNIILLNYSGLIFLPLLQTHGA